MAAGFTVDISQVVEGLNKKNENAKKVLQRTISDMRSRAPGWISTAVREEYSISAKDIKSALSIGKEGSINFGGTTVDNVTLTYRGKRLTTTHFNQKPKARPASGKPYQVTADIKKVRKVLSSRAFLMQGNASDGSVAVMRTGQSRYPIKTIRTLSIAQMIETGSGTKPRIEQVINENLEKRFENHCKQLLDKA